MTLGVRIGVRSGVGDSLTVNTSPGFQTSKRRLFVELGIVAAALLLLGALLWFGIGWVVSALLRSPPPEAERKLGAAVWETLVPLEKRCVNKRTLQYVGDVLRPLLAHQPPDFHFQYTVTDDPAVNAISLPGGFIAVNMGLLQAIESSEELAGVLAHELAHVTEHHGTQGIAARLGTLVVLSWLFGDTSLSTVAGVAGEFATLGYGRDQEREADAVGLDTLRAAHIDPKGMADLFERLAKEASVELPFFNTHPDPGERAAAARSAPATGQFKALPPLPEALSCR